MSLPYQSLDVLVCPETFQRLTGAEEQLIEQLNARIAEGSLRDRGGRRIDQPLPGGLIREDGTLVYPIRDDIPIMLVDAAIAIDS